VKFRATPRRHGLAHFVGAVVPAIPAEGSRPARGAAARIVIAGRASTKGYAMLNRNPFLQWLWGHGYEEIIPPTGPFAAASAPSPASHAMPEPLKSAVAEFVQAAQAKELAARLPASQRSAATKGADAAIEMLLDEWCGTPPRRHPWPWPGPPPWTWQIVSALSFLAHSLEAGPLREELLGIASQAAAKATGAGQATHA
jgi:hypothetical protein